MTITTNPVTATAPSLERLRAADDDIRDVIKHGASYFNLAALEIELSNLLHNPVEIMPSSSQGYAADHARSQAISVNHDT